MIEQNQYAVVFDFDGTLTPKSYVSLFREMERNAGFSEVILAKADAMRDKYLPKAVSGTLSPEEELAWFDETASLYSEARLTREKIVESLNKVQLRDGVKDCLRFLRRKNIPVAIVSYGVSNFILAVLIHNKADHLVDAIYSANLKFESGIVSGYDDRSVVLPSTKGSASKAFANLYGVREENVFGVGDSAIDAKLSTLKNNLLGIAKDEKDAEKLSQYMETVVITEAFYPVQEWLSEKINPTHNLKL